jgi:type VI secretion system protein VasI
MDRLSCFDALAKTLGVSQPRVTAQPAARGTGKWIVRTETSPIDDSKNVYLTLEANETISGMIGWERPSLVLRCKEKKPVAYIAWNVYLGLESTSILTRLDNEPATTSTWSISTDNKAAFYGDEAMPFIDTLAGHTRLLAQVTPYGEAPALVTFSLSGLNEAAKLLHKACSSSSGSEGRDTLLIDSGSMARVAVVRPQSSDQPLFDFQVEKPAAAAPSNQPPAYPAELRATKIEGQVIAKFVVDTMGKAEMNTFEILKSDHPLFTQAVRASLQNMHFFPAELGGRKVRQLIQMPFVFSLAKN